MSGAWFRLRIANSSGDDAAGLAVANQLRSGVTELNQGVLNANDATSQLQIIDGGLSNISTILDRLKTLATESASSTFSGNRATLNQEYSGLLTEVTRQASNINLNAGGSMNTNLSVYIGGATKQSNASVSINLGGGSNAVDAKSLGLAGTNVLGGSGVGVAGNTQNLTSPGATFVVGTGAGNDETFSFSVFSGGSTQAVTATVAATTTGSSLSTVLSSLNSQLNQYGITAGTGSDGTLQFSGTNAFSVKDPGTSTGTNLLTNESTVTGNDTYKAPAQGDTLTLATTGGASATVTFKGNESMSQAMAEINAQSTALGITAVANAQGTGINLVSSDPAGWTATPSTDGSAGFATANKTSVAGGGSDNTSNYTLDGASTFVAGGTETMQFTTSSGTASVTLAGTDSMATATDTAALLSKLNAQTASLGIYAVANSAGTGISFQSANSFSMTDSGATAGDGFFGAAATATTTSNTANAPTGAVTGNATSAITAINNAITQLGLTQGSVGAAENTLSYATNLAQSQISSFSSEESQIRDANIAAEAANLTKAQVLTQTSVAALAQANSEPQSILKLLQ